MSITPEEKLKRIRDSINDIKSVTEDTIKERIKKVSSNYYIENKEIADALIKFAEELVKVCGDDKNSSKCAKASYLQKVINLKTVPDNYNKNITITHDVNNIKDDTPDPTVEKDADDGSSKGDPSATVTSTDGAGGPDDGAPGSTAGDDGTPGPSGDGVPGSTAGTGVPGPPVDDGTGAGGPTDGAPVPNNSTVPIVNNTTGPPSDAADPNKVILSYDGSGKYSVKDKFEPNSNYHVLERKDKNQCYAYNPSYNPSETVPTSAEQTTLSDKAVNVGTKLQGVGTKISGAAQGVKNTLNNYFGRNKYEKMDESENLLNKKGGKRKTKKRRTTRKLNQRKLRLFKSRSKK